MTDLIEVLNATSPARTLFYCAVGLIALAIVAESVANVFIAFANRKKS